MTDEETQLCRRWRQGDEDALIELLTSYQPMVCSLAREMARWKPWVMVPDLVSAGKCGLMEAFRNFDFNRENLLRPYAIKCMKNAIWNCDEYTRCVPRHQREIYRTVVRAHDELMRELNRKPTEEEIARQAGLKRERVIYALSAMKYGHPEQPPENGFDSFGAHRAEDSEAAINKTIDDEKKLEWIKNTLYSEGFNERERVVVALYYIRDMEDHEIAEMLGLTPGNVKQIRNRTLAKLKNKLNGTVEG